MDLYDLEVGRTRGTTYKVVASHDSIYYDQLKPLIEQATGMYLSLFAKGGKVKKKYAVLRSPMGEIIADIQVDNEDKMEALKKFRDMGINEVGSIYFTDTPPYYYAKGGAIGDAARVKSKNKTGVIMKIFKADDFEQFSDVKPEKNYLIKFADGTQDTYPKSELEIFKN